MTTTTAAPRARWNRDRIERRALRLLRPLTITGLFVITGFPFLYIFILSTRDLSSIVREPGRLLPRADEWTLNAYREVLKPLDDGGRVSSR